MTATVGILLILTFCAAGFYTFVCMQGLLPYLAKRTRTGYIYAGCIAIHLVLTALAIFGCQCRLFLPFILIAHFLGSSVFMKTQPLFRLFAAATSAYLFAASRIFVRSLVCVVSGAPISIYAVFHDPSLLDEALGMVIVSFLLASGLMIMIARSAMTLIDRKRMISRKVMIAMLVAVFLLLAVTFAEAAADVVYSMPRVQAAYHLVITMLLTGGLWVLFRYSCSRDLYVRKNRMVFQEQQESRLARYRSEAKYLEEFRRFRHDYKNQLAGLKVLIDSGEYERAAEYLSGVAAKFDAVKVNMPSYSDNTLVDAVLQNLASRCEAGGIAFHASVIVGDEMPLGDPDLVTLFCNIADNAYEASEHLEKKDRFVSITTSRRVKWLTVTAENRFDGILMTDKDGIKTRKADAASHGLGLKNIRRIVESVPGAILKIDPDFDECIFRISILFPRLVGKPDSNTREQC